MTGMNEEKKIYCVSTLGSIDTCTVDMLNGALFGEFDTDADAVAAIMEHYSDKEYYELGVYRVCVQRVAKIG